MPTEQEEVLTHHRLLALFGRGVESSCKCEMLELGYELEPGCLTLRFSHWMLCPMCRVAFNIRGDDKIVTVPFTPKPRKAWRSQSEKP